MKVLQTYCLNYNLGDYALGYGLRKALRELLRVDFIAEANLQGQQFDEYFIRTVNARYDLLVIGGGGIIHGAHWPQGWFWLVEQELIKTITTPFVVYAAGYNYFKDEAGIPERGVAHLRETARRARFFSVRNDGSHGRLKGQTGIDAEVIADPGFWVGRNQDFPRPAGLPGDYVVLQLANDKPSHRFRGAKDHAEVVDRLRLLVRSLARRRPVVLAPHVFDDVALSMTVASGLDHVSVWPFADFAFDRVEHTFGYYQHADCVLAMRGHGQIVPLSFGVPTVSLENHHKHRELMQSLGLGQFNIDVMDPEMPATAVGLVEAAIAARETIAAHMAGRLAELWEGTRRLVERAFPDAVAPRRGADQ